MAFLKPQSPLTKGNDYFYPLTTADQVIMQGGYRLNDIVGKVKKSTITLYANGWSTEAPYSYSVTVKGLDDGVNMKMLPHFPEDFESKQAMKEETAKISFASRNGSILTFECWDEVPTIDIPVDIEINVLYPLEAAIDQSKLPQKNYIIIGGTEEPKDPSQNTLWVQTDTPIKNIYFGNDMPQKVLDDGDIWIFTGDNSSISFHALKIENDYLNMVYPRGVYQQIGDSLEEKTAFNYLNKKWTPLNVIPIFTYTGDYEIVDDNDNKISISTDNWKIRFLSSGTLTFSKLFGAEDGIDVFLVGGGGGGKSWDKTFTGPAGGGGYTTTKRDVPVIVNQPYDIIIGSGGTGGKGSYSYAATSGGNTTAFDLSANGGEGMAAGSTGTGGAGGSGGAALTTTLPLYGGIDGADGENSTSGWIGGIGQRTTTREFEELDGKIYANGGNCLIRDVGAPGTPNTGNGGDGGGSGYGGDGGSGIVVIRNKRY